MLTKLLLVYFLYSINNTKLALIALILVLVSKHQPGLKVSGEKQTLPNAQLFSLYIIFPFFQASPPLCSSYSHAAPAHHAKTQVRFQPNIIQHHPTPPTIQIAQKKRYSMYLEKLFILKFVYIQHSYHINSSAYAFFLICPWYPSKYQKRFPVRGGIKKPKTFFITSQYLNRVNINPLLKVHINCTVCTLCTL